MAADDQDDFSSLRDLAARTTELQGDQIRFKLEQFRRQHPPVPDAYTCSVCEDTTWALYTDAKGVRRTRRCECFLNLPTGDRRTWAENVPEDCRGARLANLDVHLGNRHAIGAGQEWLKHERRDLCFIGPVGCGKTYLACALANEAFDRWVLDGIDGVGPFFVRWGFLLQEQMRGIGTDPVFANQANRLLDRARAADPLVLDDIGAADKNSDYGRRSLLTLLDERADKGRRTIVTSNLSMRELAAHYDDRVVSRILGGCGGEVLELSGVDRRLARRVPGTRRKLVNVKSR